MKYSIVIPAHNEEDIIHSTIEELASILDQKKYNYEILVVADHCTDSTEKILEQLQKTFSALKWITNDNRPGFGMAVRAGLDNYTGDAVAIFMADKSDNPKELCTYFDKINSGTECVFGSRFIKGSKIVDYPKHKLILNRLGNWFIRLLFRHGYNDTTNAFKCYKREVIDGCRPFLASHFNLTVEIPLKAIIRGYQFEIVPISWHNRTTGTSKLKIKEMGSRYFFVIFYCFLEKWLTGNDYHRQS